jgi:hypothetical protein
MLFEDKKLQLESVEDMIRCPVVSVEAFALMLSPVYVLMKLNKKLVSVKAPLDFFTEEELSRLKSHEVFYLPKFALSSVRFQTAGRLVKNILTIKNHNEHPAPYEQSREIFNVLGPLWGKQIQLEPFFLCVLAEELCEPLDSEMMLWARENALVKHDLALLISGTLVFIALNLGWFNLKQLSEVRKEIYEKTVQGEDWSYPQTELESIVSDVYRILDFSPSLNIETLRSCNRDWSQKILSRLEYLMKVNPNMKYESVTIYGEEGFAA